MRRVGGSRLPSSYLPIRRLRAQGQRRPALTDLLRRDTPERRGHLHIRPRLCRKVRAGYQYPAHPAWAFLRLVNMSNNHLHPVFQQAISPWTPAELQAMDEIEARQEAEQERRLHRAIQEQQQRLQSTGDIV